MNQEQEYDVVVVGAGVCGALTAKSLTNAKVRVLLLEAGPATAWTFDGYMKHLEHFYGVQAKGPEAPWPPAVGAPQPDTHEVRTDSGYFVQKGPQKYASSYTRYQGGSTLHWLGVALRMLPEDFKLRSRYGVGRDWPLDYSDLEPYYRKAEFELGVAADVADQAHLGVEFAPGYDYPMRRIPPSYSDQMLAAAVDGMRVNLGAQEFTLTIRNYPAARNGIPRGDFIPDGAVDERTDGQALGRDIGQRCQGNTSCTPICPVQAKYNAMKTLAKSDRGNLQVLAQAVVSKINVDPASGAVESVEYKRYEDRDSSRHTVHRAKARIYVLAAHAVENAKLMLASGLGGRSGQLGANLMDHPCLYAWGLMPAPAGAFRGPLSTAGLDDLRGGAFRAEHAAFRFDIGNDGWHSTTGAPDTSVAAAVNKERLFGVRLRRHLASNLSRQIRFSLAVEQLPSEDNRVTIDRQYLDPLGNHRPVISYHIDEYTLDGMAAAAAVARKVFERASVTDCTNPEEGTWFPSVSHGDRVFHYHGMGHFSGTHVMGDSPESSVVNPDQRSWEHRNLYLIGSGSFPSMGTSNPTLTMAALAIRTADRLIAELVS
jgi:choline dehydrogenase-like flavoprotein